MHISRPNNIVINRHQSSINEHHSTKLDQETFRLHIRQWQANPTPSFHYRSATELFQSVNALSPWNNLTLPKFEFLTLFRYLCFEIGIVEHQHDLFKVDFQMLQQQPRSQRPTRIRFISTKKLHLLIRNDLCLITIII